MTLRNRDVRFAPKSDIIQHGANVRFVPKADILQCGRNWHYSITHWPDGAETKAQ